MRTPKCICILASENPTIICIAFVTYFTVCQINVVLHLLRRSLLKVCALQVISFDPLWWPPPVTPSGYPLRLPPPVTPSCYPSGYPLQLPPLVTPSSYSIWLSLLVTPSWKYEMFYFLFHFFQESLVWLWFLKISRGMKKSLMHSVLFEQLWGHPAHSGRVQKGPRGAVPQKR